MSSTDRDGDGVDLGPLVVIVADGVFVADADGVPVRVADGDFVLVILGVTSGWVAEGVGVAGRAVSRPSWSLIMNAPPPITVTAAAAAIPVIHR